MRKNTTNFHNEVNKIAILPTKPIIYLNIQKKTKLYHLQLPDFLALSLVLCVLGKSPHFRLESLKIRFCPAGQPPRARIDQAQGPRWDPEVV